MENKSSIWTRNFIVLFAGNFLLQIGNYMTTQLISLYAKSLGAGDLLIGTIVSIFYTVALLSRPLSGPAIDCWNRRRFFVILNICIALCMFGYAFSGGLNGIFVFRIINGITYGTSTALCLAMATQNMDYSVLATGIALFSISQNLPQAVGPAMGLYLSENYGYPVAYIVSGILMLCGALVGLKLEYPVEEKKQFKIDIESMISLKALVPMLLIVVTGIGYGAINSFYAVMIKDKELAGLSLYYTVYAISMVVFKPILAKFSEKYGVDKALYPMFISFALCLFLMSRCSNAFEVVFCGVLQALGFDCAFSLMQTLVILVTPREKRGAGSSTCFIGMDIGLTLGGFIAGSIATALGYARLFFIMSIFVLIGIPVLYFWTRAKGGVPVCDN